LLFMSIKLSITLKFEDQDTGKHTNNIQGLGQLLKKTHPPRKNSNGN